ncbi:hypothetical protein RHMOL_Rhmol08G0128800 [Rhododendron molle]|uniref:Uncharacterized protein n=1 Tax=Rhododendron molle TaxID=49168 RepID=A0ACC0MP02_RHOML|nr:hypothetical protein RHMOL_Rhmol08G0128800 [Rhododendron molle]
MENKGQKQGEFLESVLFLASSPVWELGWPKRRISEYEKFYKYLREWGVSFQ